MGESTTLNLESSLVTFKALDSEMVSAVVSLGGVQMTTSSHC